MSTVEQLLMGIFDRKRSVEEQMRQQVHSYALSLASNLIADGRRPPPWLLAIALADSADGLTREELISRILLPPPQATNCLASCSTRFMLPTFRGNDIPGTNDFYGKDSTSSRYLSMKDTEKSVLGEVIVATDKAETAWTEAVNHVALRTVTSDDASVNHAAQMPLSSDANLTYSTSHSKPEPEKVMEDPKTAVNTNSEHKDESAWTEGAATSAVTTTPDAISIKPDHTVLNVGHLPRSFDVNVTNSNSHCKIQDNFLEAQETDDYANSAQKDVTVTLNVVSLTPNPVNTPAMTEVGPISLSSDANVTNSTSHCSIKAAKVLLQQETADYVNLMQRHVRSLIPKVTDIESTLPQTQDSLRNFSNFDTELDSHKGEDYVLHSSDKNSVLPEAYTSDINTVNMEVAENDIREHKVASVRSEIHTAEPTDVYLDHACETTELKIRKLESRSISSLYTSPRLRLKPTRSILSTADPIRSNCSENTVNTPATADVGYIAWSGDANVTNPISHSSIKAPKVLEQQETVECTMRSFSNFDMDLDSDKGDDYVLHSSEKNCIFPVAYTSETYTGGMEVAEKDITEHRVTSDSSEVHTAGPKDKYLVGCFPSQDEDCVFPKSVGVNTEPIFGGEMVSADRACETTGVKRRMLAGRSISVQSTSPRLRLEPIMYIQKASDSIYTNCSENTVNTHAPTEVSHDLRSSDANITNSTSHSSLEALKVLVPQETVVSSPMQRLAISLPPDFTDTENILPQTSYGLGSLSSFGKKPDSHKGKDDALLSSCAVSIGDMEVAEKDITEYSETSDSREIHAAEPIDKSLIGCLPSHREDCVFSKSHGMNGQPVLGERMVTSDHACETTWPKRRKMEGRSTNVFATSPRLRLKPALFIQKVSDPMDIVSGPMDMNHSENISGPIIECESLKFSNETGSKILEASSNSCLEERHQTMEQCTNKDDSDLSGKGQVAMTPLLIKSRHEVLLPDLADGDLQVIAGLGNDQDAMTPLLNKSAHEVLLPTFAEGDLDTSLKDTKAIAELTALNLKQYHDSVDGQCFVHAGKRLEHQNTKRGSYLEELTENLYRESGSFTHDLSKPVLCDGNLDSYSEIIPEFEGFIIDAPTKMEDGNTSNYSDLSSLKEEHASLLEKLCETESMLNSESRPSEYTIDDALDVYQPSPVRFLDRQTTSSSPQFDDVNLKQLRVGQDGKATIPFYSMRQEPAVSLWGRSPSYNICSTAKYDSETRKPPLTPISGEKLHQRASSHSANIPSIAKYDRKARKPPLTPVPGEKLRQRAMSRSRSSSKEVGSNPDHICFRIDENPGSSFENLPVKELDSISAGKFHPTWMKNSTDRTSLVDVSEVYQNAPVSVPEKHLNRSSLRSVNTESYFGIQLDANSSSRHEHTGGRKWEAGDKENIASSVSGSKGSKFAESFTMSSKPEMSMEATVRNQIQAIPCKAFKNSNIVSKKSSFIPLIRQRQQEAALVTGKRDIRVKALEAAEAAKRLEEKKQKEREIRKATVKLERERVEEESIREMCHIQKVKGEARKKKEAEFAARKRQREEDRKEKESKRICAEVKKQQKERLHVQKGKKELQCHLADGKKHGRAERTKETKKLLKSEKVSDGSGWNKPTNSEPTITTVAYGDPGSKSLEVHDSYKESTNTNKAVKNSYVSQKAIKDKMSVTKESPVLPSYALTPYRDSDDEGGEEDIRRERKFIPLWARKENLDQILRSNSHMDPTVIFSRKSSFNLSEVLSR